MAIFALFLYRGFRFRWGATRARANASHWFAWRGLLGAHVFAAQERPLLIERFLGEKEVGVYGVATNFTDMVQRVANIASVILLAKIVRGQDDTRLSLGGAKASLSFSCFRRLS